ncbi:MAG: acyl carrier protein [Lachnospiraceae bacterium]|nr:acyl carrier protein [Lachnospiraceae bacterium]
MAVSGKEAVLAYAKKRSETCEQLKEMIVQQLCLDIEPGFLTDDQPLFGRGLELDSIDSLELAVGIYDKFGVTIADGEVEVFSSVNYMADYVMANIEEDESDRPGVEAGGFIDLDA